MTLDHRMHMLREIRSVLSLAVYPVEYMVTLPSAAGDWVGESFTTREKLMSEVTSLKTEQLLLNARLQKFAALEAENVRLRRMLDSSREVSEKVLIAELLSVDLEPYSRHIVVNKGSQQGIYEGQPVLDAKGIMGQVIHVTPLTSTVILITDPNHAIPVAINRNGMRAIAIGTGSSDELELPHFPTNADVEVGDLLVTSGLGGRFPAGYPVGIVASVKKDPGESFAQVIAKPAAELERNNEVLMVWPHLQPEETATPEASSSADGTKAQPGAPGTTPSTATATATATANTTKPNAPGVPTDHPKTEISKPATPANTTSGSIAGQNPTNKPKPPASTPPNHNNPATTGGQRQ